MHEHFAFPRPSLMRASDDILRSRAASAASIDAPSNTNPSADAPHRHDALPAEQNLLGHLAEGQAQRKGGGRDDRGTMQRTAKRTGEVAIADRLRRVAL